MKTCENCGSRVYSLGCVNCDEEAYISEQETLSDYYAEEAAAVPAVRSRRRVDRGQVTVTHD